MDNTVGSLTQSQKSLIIGSILGDGYIRKITRRRDAFLEINHSIKAKDYVDWKFSILEKLCRSAPVARKIDDKRIAYRFFTKQHPEITVLLNKFYRNRKKIIPKDLKLNSLILTVWFMDDGSKSRKRDVYLNSQQFSLNDQKRLLYLLRQMGLKARLNRDKKYYRIRFLKESILKLNQVIETHIIPSMRYKMSYDPVETSLIKNGESPLNTTG